MILTDDGRVVLVKRGHEPLKGEWSLPGGLLELGETLEAGVAREIREETGLVVDVGPLVELFDRIFIDGDGAVQYHFVLADYLCRPRRAGLAEAATRRRRGRLEAGTDVDDVVLADPGALEPFRLTEKTRAVIARACIMAGRAR